MPFLGISPKLLQERNKFVASKEYPARKFHFTIEIRDGKIATVNEGWKGVELNREDEIRETRVGEMTDLIQGFVKFLDDIVSPDRYIYTVSLNN
jgi:hypothetical protein